MEPQYPEQGYQPAPDPYKPQQPYPPETMAAGVHVQNVTTMGRKNHENSGILVRTKN
jgi:hypothetical protein